MSTISEAWSHDYTWLYNLHTHEYMTIHDCTHARYKIHGSEHYLWGMSTWLYMIVQFTHAWTHDYAWLYSWKIQDIWLDMIVQFTHAWIHDYTWLYTWKIQYTWQWAVLAIYDAWAHVFTWLFTCIMQDTWQWALWDKKGVRKNQLKFILFNLYRLVLSLLKYKKAKAHPWQLCRSLHWVWGSRPGDLWAIGSTKMTS